MFLVGAFSLRKKARLLQWVVFFSLQSHSEWSSFLTILTILQFLLFLLSLRSSIFTSSRNSAGPGGTPLEYFRLCEAFFGISPGGPRFGPKGPPFNFLIFSHRMDVENPPFQFFWHCETFFIFFIKGSPIHQYFDILKSFCCFWALDMAPTWAVPGLLILTLQISRQVSKLRNFVSPEIIHIWTSNWMTQLQQKNIEKLMMFLNKPRTASWSIFFWKTHTSSITFEYYSRVDPLTSILVVLARSCQILTTSWQPWIPWQDSY